MVPRVARGGDYGGTLLVVRGGDWLGVGSSPQPERGHRLFRSVACTIEADATSTFPVGIPSRLILTIPSFPSYPFHPIL